MFGAAGFRRQPGSGRLGIVFPFVTVRKRSTQPLPSGPVLMQPERKTKVPSNVGCERWPWSLSSARRCARHTLGHRAWGVKHGGMQSPHLHRQGNAADYMCPQPLTPEL